MNGEECLRQAYDAIFQGDFESAIRSFAQAIELEPDNAEYYYRGSITCARSGKTNLAVAYARKAVELNPNESSYVLNLRTIQCKERIVQAKELLERNEPDIERSAVLLLEAVRLDPLSAEAKLLLGIVFRVQGDFRKAIESLQDALLIEPALEEAKRLLSEIRSERRRLLKQQYSHYHSKRNR